MGSAFKIERLSLGGLETMLAWSGWSTGPSDAACFLSADPEGFLGAYDNTRLIGAVAAIRYGSRFGFMGPILVDPPYQGLGIENQLAAHALEHLGNRTIGHVSHPHFPMEGGHPEGFQPAHKQVRFRGPTGALRGSPQREVLRAKGSFASLDKLPNSVVQGFDSLYFPGPRAAFLREWIRAGSHRAVGWLENGPAKSLKGVGVIRPSPAGWLVGPLFARSPEIAAGLLAELTEPLSPEEILLWDIPQPNRPAIRIAREAGLEQVLETVRCYRNGQVSIAPETVYGLTSLELG